MNKAICCICSKVVSVLKEFNVKGHYNTNYASTFGKCKGQFCKAKMSELKTKQTIGTAALFYIL